ncbi:Inorganic phosphate transporter 1-1 [Thalictrum thalictroides]|uniref:Inorganic phosphate transporter 1-1 n=1 Tax=Thalictrum thalictroides TaxID=46969 RepID=A0A7J6V858_THATH|nr:Inorganic phosphate transporter 1-1 [Thalictrum thalictroides]
MADDNNLKVFNTLDNVKTQFFHFKAVVISGMGFYTDAYDLFCISLVTKLLGRIYYHVEGSSKPGSLPPNVSAAVNGVALCGTLVGQLFFGWLGDKMGRKKVYGITLMIMVFSSIASGLSFGHSAKGVMTTLCFFRFLLGFVSTIFNNVYKSAPYQIDPIASTVPEADYVWRIILMFGALPAALTFYSRMKMPETPRYTALVAKNAEQAASDMSKVLQVEVQAEQEKVKQLTKRSSASFGLFTKAFARRHGLHLLGTASTWFLLDIAYYSQNLFQKDIFTSVGWIPPAKTMNAIEEVFKISKAQTLLALCSTVPGYWFTVALIDILGRFFIQMMGFFFMTVFMLLLAIPYHHWTRPSNNIGFIVLYGFTFFFANFGPNATTFIVPAEIFPARLRATCHGISAAAGKAGAIVGAFGFLYLAQNQDKSKADAGYPAGIGMKNSLILLAVINFLGLLCTFLVPEPNGKSLEDLSGENEDDNNLEAEAKAQAEGGKNITLPV